MQIYNSFSKKKENFRPVEEGKIRIYTCGPTVYSYAHVGNFSSFLMADLLVRYFKYKGNDVDWIMNITDVGHMTDDDQGSGDSGDDKLEKAAQKENKTVWEVARFYEEAFLNDLKKLNFTRATKYPRATEHVEEMIAMIKEMEAKGFTYETSDGLYFDISKFPAYGKLSGNVLENLNAGSRVEINEDKRSPFDFALWKKLVGDNEKHAMKWDSPWGMGFPGWHLECSAMSRKYLGDTLDFHTGGEDNKFPHHESEIAQSESVTGKRFVNYWLHKSRVIVNNEKMSKSLGNFFTVNDLIKKGYKPEAIRYTFISAHYRSKLNFTLEALEESQKSLDRFNEFIQTLLKLAEKEGETDEKKLKSIEAILKSTRQQFEKALEDDLNVSAALASLFGLLKSMRKQINKGNLNAAGAKLVLELLKDVDSVFAVFDFEKLKEKSFTPEEEAKITELIAKRNSLREEKKWQEADAIRDELLAMGATIQDQKL